MGAVAKQWDNVARMRDAQIRSGRDVSYRHVLMPTLLGLAAEADWRRVLDIGCGTGVLTEALAARAGTVVGVDPSRQSIALAEASLGRSPNASYVNASVESFAAGYMGRPFTLAVANMVLQDVSRLDETLDAVAQVLLNRAFLVCTITHPCFWPVYWGYDDAEWFDYGREIAIEAPFRISSVRRAVGVTTHYHRPIDRYFAALRRAGFRLDCLLEPMPTPAVQRLYPRPWRYPRFLALRCRRIA
jgi:trans-aconitate methyltransferase